jgi:hypothetical protein
LFSRNAFDELTTLPAAVATETIVPREVQETPVTIGEERFDTCVGLSFDSSPLEYRYGAAMTPQLINDLGFIRKKSFWAAYVRRAIVPAEAGDVAVVRDAVAAAARRQTRLAVAPPATSSRMP